MQITVIKKLNAAKKLYRSAFPKEERLPWWVLRLSAWKKDVALTAYGANGEFCGFTHTTVTEDVLFIMFFAVQEGLRRQGCGSAILEYLKREHPGRAIILNVEPLDAAAPNAQERINRMRFYKKNGFFDTGYNIDEVGGTFRVLSTSPRLNPQSYLQVFKKLSFGLWRPKISRVTK